MANKPDINKRRIHVRLDISVCRAVVKKYGQPEDPNDNLSYVRALEDAARDVVLSADDWMAIAEEVRRNEMKLNSKKGN